MEHPEGVFTVALTSEEKSMTTASTDWGIRAWMWQQEDLIDVACNRLTRILTEDELEQSREACLDVSAMMVNLGFDLTDLLLTGMQILILPLAAVLALLVSISLLKLYRRAVLKSMLVRTPSQTTESASPEASASLDQRVRGSLDLAVLDHASPIAAEPVAEALRLGVLRALRRTATTYAIAGFSYAFVMAAAFLVAANGGVYPLWVLPFLLWVFAWPVVLTVDLVAAMTWRAKLATASAYFFVLAVLGTIHITMIPEFGWDGAAILWLLANLPATVLLLAFLNRRVRAVGPLVLTFMVLAITGPIFALVVAVSDEGRLRAGSDLGAALGVGVDGVLIGLIVLSLVAFGLAGWLALRWIRTRYEQKKISDQSITLDAVWLMFGVTQPMSLVSFADAAWILSGLVAFVAYKVATRAGFLLLGREASRKSPKLLLLRVFSLGKRSERLFDAITTYWRHAGDIRLIVGPDLATTTVEPHEFLDFMSGKLARRFIDAPRTLDLRISEMDIEPDQDGRYRVNDFFCYEDTWKMALSRLVSESDAVLMDLRGFSRQNAGAAFEIDELINVVPLERVVFIVDDTTDERFLRQTVQQSWDRMRPTSPNVSSTPGPLRLFRFTGSRSGELQQLLRSLCVAANAEPQITTGSSTG